MSKLGRNCNRAFHCTNSPTVRTVSVRARLSTSSSNCRALHGIVVHNQRIQFQRHGLVASRRLFHDYFVQVLPPSSQHPDRSEKQLARIPLISAKHHFGVESSRGERAYNEDSWQAGVVELVPFGDGGKSGPAKKGTEEDGGTSTGLSSVFYFGVFDGHGGNVCSKFLRECLHEYLEESSNTLGLTPPPSKPMPKKERLEIQGSLIANWRTSIGGYFRRFKPDFDTAKDQHGNVIEKSKPKNIQQDPPASVENLLVYTFLKTDLDFTQAEGRASFLAAEKVNKHIDEDGERGVMEMQTALGDVNGMYTVPPLQRGSNTNPFKGGSTCSIALVSMPPQQNQTLPFWHPLAIPTIVTAHTGDTRILICETKTGKALPLTTNHHPALNSEARRLRQFATSFVSDSFGEERFGVLANTRSFGDIPQKRLGVSAEPEISRVTMQEAGEFAFMVLVSDGVSGTLSDQEIVDIVKDNKGAKDAAKAIVDFAVQVTKDGDNATAMVVRLGGWEHRGTGAGTKEMRDWKKSEAEQVRSRRM